MSKKKNFSKIADRTFQDKPGRMDESTKRRINDSPKTEYANLNFKLLPDNKLRFKQLALNNGMKLNEFLLFLMDEYEARK